MRMPIANEKREIPWCAPSIRVDLRGDSLPNQIIKSRNRALLALCIQFAATIAGFMFYFFRRNRVYLVVNMISASMLCCGAIGVLHVRKWWIAFHGVMTSAVLGVFFFYSILEVLFREDLAEGKDLHMSERNTLLLLSLPYLLDFCSGCVTFYLAFLLLDHDEKAKKTKQVDFNSLTDDIELPSSYNESDKLCCICMSSEKNTVIYPCGHAAFCLPCSISYKNQNNRCPICRINYKDIISVR